MTDWRKMEEALVAALRRRGLIASKSLDGSDNAVVPAGEWYFSRGSEKINLSAVARDLVNMQ